MAEPSTKETAQPSAAETTQANDIYLMAGAPKEMVAPKKQAAVVLAIKPSEEELRALRLDLRKFLLAYDAHVNDDSDNFGYDRSAH